MESHIQPSHTDQFYMQRALELALNGQGSVSPNPLVGCVIVKNDRIIGEGWHKQYGGPHAEVHAVQSVDSDELIAGGTVYVNLEPCAHYGKTPPCAELLISKQVSRVVIANKDPNPLVAGKGLAMLKEAGIEVVTGVLEDQGQELNRRFFTYIEKKRPYVILKWAQTADGFIARKDFDSKWISGELSRKLVHKWRAEEDAIMVATHTARYDNPRLDVRDWSGRNPLRVVIDKKLELSPSLHLFDSSTPTLLYNTVKTETTDNLEWVRVDEHDMLDNILNDLYSRNIQSVIVEGGAALHKNFVDEYIWDEARVFISPNTFGGGIDAARITSPYTEDRVGDDKLLVYRNKKKWQKN